MLVKEMLKELKDHGFHMAVVSRETGIDNQLLIRALKGQTELRESDINTVRKAHQRMVNKGQYLNAVEQKHLSSKTFNWSAEEINQEENAIKRKGISLFALINDRAPEDWAVNGANSSLDETVLSNTDLMRLASDNVVYRFTDDQKLSALYEIVRRLRGNI